MHNFGSLPSVDQLPDLGLTHHKRSFKDIQRENETRDDLRGKTVLVTGGTSGIGAAVAIAFAKRGCSIYIGGRNASAASQVLNKAKSESMYPNSEQIFEFHSFDASLVSDCKRFAADIGQSLSAAGGLDFLVMTQGGIGNGERRETEEGHEMFLALQDFSRFIVAAMLVPVLRQNEPGVVLDILAAGVWNKFDPENFELLDRSPNFFNVASRDGAMHDSLTLEFNERCPGIIYNHLYPGPIRTSMTSKGESEFLIKLGFDIAARLIGQSVDQFAEVVFNIGTKWISGGHDELCRTWGASGEKVSPRDYPSREDVRKTVWNFLERSTGVELPQIERALTPCD